MYYVYIATNFTNSVLYTGMTNNLKRRMHEHRNKLTSGFSSKYNIKKLIYYDTFDNPKDAIAAEKRVKGWTRIKKINLIKTINPEFRNLDEKD